MTTALYRRYRPDTFEDVIGQEHVTDALKTALASGRVAHAFLFSGPRGCGKTTSARIMARALNCAEGPTATPCGKCPSCIDLAVGGPGSLDVTEIDAASNRGVEAAAQLRERLIVAPSRDRYRIFILDEAHMVTTEGFNALLKVVEEPPEHVKFIFATTAPEKVLSTIRSRTHHYPFRLVGPEILVPYLKKITEQEGVTLEESVYPLVVRSGGGSVRDSLSVLDQLIAGSDGHVTAARAIELLGYTDTVLLERTIDALGEGDGAAVFQIIEEVVSSGQEPRRFVEDLLQRLRDLMVCALAGERAGDILVEVPADQIQVMHQQAQRWGPPLLSRRADVVEGALREMHGATAPRLQLELLMARLLVSEPGAGASSCQVVEPAAQEALAAKRGEGAASVARAVDAPETSSQAPAPAPSPSPTPARSAEPDLQVPDTDAVRSQWQGIVREIGKYGAALPMLLQTVKRVDPVGGHVYFFLEDPAIVQRFKSFGGEQHLSTVLTSLFGRAVSGRVAPLMEADQVVAAGGEARVNAEVLKGPVGHQPAVNPTVERVLSPMQPQSSVAPPLEPQAPAPTPTYTDPPVEPPPYEMEAPSGEVHDRSTVEPRVQQAPAPSPDVHRGKPAADIVLDILGGTVLSERIVGGPAEFEGPEPVEPDPHELTELDLEVP